MSDVVDGDLFAFRQNVGLIPFEDGYLTEEQCDQRMEIATKTELAR